MLNIETYWNVEERNQIIDEQEEDNKLKKNLDPLKSELNIRR